MSTFHEGVDPVRLRFMLERSAVLAQYCAIERPTNMQTARFAKKLGVSTGALYRLAKAWRLLPKLKGMGGARVKPERKPKLSETVMRIIEGVIVDRGPGSSVKKIYQAVCKECQSAAINPPTLSAVHERVMKARSEARPPDTTRRFSVFQCRVDLPVAYDGHIRAPYITGIIDLPSKRIINLSISFGTPDSLAVAVQALLADRHGREGITRITVPTKKLAELSKEIEHPLEAAGRNYSAPALLGRAIDTLNILHRSYPGADEKLAKKIVGRMNSALSEHEAIIVIEAAIKAHNHKCGDTWEKSGSEPGNFG